MEEVQVEVEEFILARGVLGFRGAMREKMSSEFPGVLECESWCKK
jgi:hypothetical protein